MVGLRATHRPQDGLHPGLSVYREADEDEDEDKDGEDEPPVPPRTRDEHHDRCEEWRTGGGARRPRRARSVLEQGDGCLNPGETLERTRWAKKKRKSVCPVHIPR